MMKKVLKITAMILGVVVVLVLLMAIYIHFSGIPKYSVEKVDLKVEITPARVEQGQKIATMECIACHAAEDGKLTGRYLKELPPEFGEISSRNITQNKQVGIGDWTDGEIYYLLRTGIKRDGQYIPPYMAKFPNASEEDIYSIIAWLRSDKFCVQPSTTEASESKPSFLTKFLSRVAFKPLPINKAPIPSPDTTNKVEWGRYLSTAVYGCYACHSADFKTMNEVEPEKSGGYFGGGNVMKDLSNKDVVTSNLTFDETGIAKLTLEQFINEVRYCKKPDGSMLRYPMFPHNGLTDSEVAAIYEYLKTLPKINHKIASN